MSAIVLGAASPGLTRSFDAAMDAWERGDYIAALNGYIQVVGAPGGDAFVQPIALTTGELFVTRELTPDGRAARFSPDDKLIAYETGLETSRRTRVLRNDAARTAGRRSAGRVGDVLVHAEQVAYLRIPDNEEIRRAAAALEQASLTAQNRNQLTQMLTWLIAKHSTIVTRDLANGREMELPAPDLLKTGLTFAADGRQLYFLGAKESDPERTDIYVISESAPKPVLVADAGGLKSAPIVDPAGKVLIYTVPAVNPLRRPATPGEAGAGRAGALAGQSSPGAANEGRAGQASGGRGGQAAAPPAFVIVDLATRTMTMVVGSAPSLSADGSTLAYVARNGAEYSRDGRSDERARRWLRSGRPMRLDSPALSPDGSRIAYQMMPRDDWEIFIADRDGGNERQLTHEIQHDLLPRFIGAGRLLALIGEPRHRRSYLYDLRSDPGLTLNAGAAVSQQHGADDCTGISVGGERRRYEDSDRCGAGRQYCVT